MTVLSRGLKCTAHPPKYSGGLRFQTAGRLAIERDLLFLRWLLVFLEISAGNFTLFYIGFAKHVAGGIDA
jgi:hypothetical protein